ncbi:MAG: ribonuclease P protein component [Acidiferrobacterales bacterium]|nr:ribonuclease P protein component [Gammaproteobacteria bacterium]
MTRARPPSREGLPKRHRLLRSSAFSVVLRQGCRTRDRCFAVYVVANALPHVRLGLVVSRKVSLRAVVRNRLKRHIRESVRRHQQALAGLDLVVVAYREAAEAEARRLRASLERHWTDIVGKCKRSS